MYTLGIDIGSSSVKVSAMDIVSGDCAASATFPAQEMEIIAKQAGWAEQNPLVWWEHICSAIKQLAQSIDMQQVQAIGITYQMHGLVCLDKAGTPLRDAIIWCDSRAVAIGEKALQSIGVENCLSKTLNSPGNFTASKLFWVKENEPELYAQIDKFMLPGDFIAYQLSGEIATTETGLSEQILWDFTDKQRADFIAEYFDIDKDKIPVHLPAIGVQTHTSPAIEALLGIKAGTPIAYRAGDQPNNAFSLNVLDHGELAATAGTSGVVYGVTKYSNYDPQSRVNTFLHVNSTAEDPRNGVLLCINGTGILNAWVHRNFAQELSYKEIDEICANIPAGSDGLLVLPFGNGAERMLQNRHTGASFSKIDLNRHDKKHILRALQEGIAFAFRYGIDIMRSMGVEVKMIRAGKANLFLSPIFRETLATLCDAEIELYNSDGSLGAARGAALGAGIFTSREQAFASLKKVDTTSPNPAINQALEDNYQLWCQELEAQLLNTAK